MDRDEHHPVGIAAAGDRLAVDAVRQVPAQVAADARVGDRVGRRGQHGVAARGAEHVAIDHRPVLAVARRHHRPRGGLSEQAADPHHDVVDVGALPDPVDDGAAVAAAVAGVEDDGHALEVRRPHHVGVARALRQLALVLLAPRMAGGQVLGREVLERNAHRIADRDVGDVGDAAALGDLLRQRVDVLGEDAAGEADDDARVERFAALEPVDRVVALVVALVGERSGAGFLVPAAPSPGPAAAASAGSALPGRPRAARPRAGWRPAARGSPRPCR